MTRSEILQNTLNFMFGRSAGYDQSKVTGCCKKIYIIERVQIHNAIVQLIFAVCFELNRLHVKKYVNKKIIQF